MPASPSTTCCEAAPRSGPDAPSAPAAGSLCCGPYESRLLAPGRAELNAALGMYSAPYAAGQGYGNYLPYGAEPAALYTALVSARPPGSAPGARGVQQAGGGNFGVPHSVRGSPRGMWDRERRRPVGGGGEKGLGGRGERGGPVLLDAKRCRLPLQNPQYEIKDGAGTLHSGIAQPATYYSYDHSLGQYQYDR